MMVWLMRALVSNTTSSTLWVAAPGMALILDVNLCMLFPTTAVATEEISPTWTLSLRQDHVAHKHE